MVPPTASPEDEDDGEEDDDGGYNLSARASSMNLQSYNQQYNQGQGSSVAAAEEDDDETTEAAPKSDAIKKGEKKKGGKKSRKGKRKPKAESEASPTEQAETVKEPAVTEDESEESKKKGVAKAAKKKKGSDLPVSSKGSEEICETYELENVDIEFTEEDYQTLTTYKAFCQHVRPMLIEANQKVAMAKILALLGAKWREFLDKHPYPDILRTAKHMLQPPPEGEFRSTQYG